MKGHPKGLISAALSNMGERFGYYIMNAVLTLFLCSKFGLSDETGGLIYSFFYAGIYILSLVGGIIADRTQNYKGTIQKGLIIMALGYVVLSVPILATPENKAWLLPLTCFALFLIAFGNGLFKGNLQAIVGQMYDNFEADAAKQGPEALKEAQGKRDSGFQIFYVFINIGGLVAPFVAPLLRSWWLKVNGFIYNSQLPRLCHEFISNGTTSQNFMDEAVKAGADPAMLAQGGEAVGTFCTNYLDVFNAGIHYSFIASVVAMMISLVIFLANKKKFPTPAKKAASTNAGYTAEEKATMAKEIKQRMYALFAVLGVVIFFWLAFHQNGQSLTWFARDYTQSTAEGWSRIGFNIWALALIATSVYTLFGIFQSEKTSGKVGCGAVTAVLWCGAYAIFRGLPNPLEIQPQLFQQFNPFFVVALTPVSMAIFSALAAKKTAKHPEGMEPSAPKKIGIGMLVAACGYLVMIFASIGQPSPASLNGTVAPDPVVPMYLIGTYLILTFAELLLSPMGISFVSKVAPPKYKGLMMGLWFAATAVGNYLSSIPGLLWKKVSLTANWSILMGLCIAAGVVMFALLKKLEAATKD